MRIGGAGPPRAARRYLTRALKIRKLILAAPMATGLAGSGLAATYSVRLAVPNYGATLLQGQLFFGGRFLDQAPTWLTVTQAPGGSPYLGSYTFDDPDAAFFLDKTTATIIGKPGLFAYEDRRVGGCLHRVHPFHHGHPVWPSQR